jgi:hypothetical protein
MNTRPLKLSSETADSQYSDGKLRNAVDEAVIPYRANQKRDVEGLLRVDEKFRTYGPEEKRKKYHKRLHIEAIYSFLKTQHSLAINKVRGLGNVVSYALFSILCLVLNREAAQNPGRIDKVGHQHSSTRNIGTRQRENLWTFWCVQKTSRLEKPVKVDIFIAVYILMSLNRKGFLMLIFLRPQIRTCSQSSGAGVRLPRVKPTRNHNLLNTGEKS